MYFTRVYYIISSIKKESAGCISKYDTEVEIMKVLVVGNGGREHAIAWKLAQSPKIEKIYMAPTNIGAMDICEGINLKVDDIEGLLDFAKKEAIDFTVVGPELPLNLGIADTFIEAGLKIFAPNKKAAYLEGSKAYAKDFMKKYDIPTAAYETYIDTISALEGLKNFQAPLVIKADGLAAGKGVIIAMTMEEAETAIKEMMGDHKFGSAGDKIVIEEFLVGKEASILAFVDGVTAVPMVSAQDYKRALDGDHGLNTGGMGAVSPAFYYTEEAAENTEKEIIQKTLTALQKEGIDYKGVLYFGLMITASGVKVIEFNTRFGDPETETVLMRLDSDLLEIMLAVAEERLGNLQIQWKKDCGVCVVMASGGYPEAFIKGYEIKGLPVNREDLTVFHSGTRAEGDSIVTNGGRVLVVSALGETVEEAREKAYETVKKISFEQVYYRSDIAKK